MNNILRTNIPVKLLMLGSLILLLLLVSYDVFFSMVNVWASRSEYSHGFLVPFISCYLAWSKRDKLRTIEISPNLAMGLLLLFAGIGLLAFGRFGNIKVLEFVSIVVVVPGLVLTMFGTRVLKELALPLFYLAFMVPAFELGTDAIHLPFQLFTAKVSSILLTALQVPVHLKSQYLELPNIQLEVAHECSGLNYLISIMAIAIPVAYLSFRDWRRFALLGSALIIGVAANSARVTLIGLWTYYFNNTDAVHGPFHIFQGFFVSIIGFIFLFSCAWALGRFFSGKEKEEKDKPEQATSGISVPVKMRHFARAWVISIVIIAGVAAYLNYHEIKPIRAEAGLENFPVSFGGWTGQPGQPSFTLAGADREVSMTYKHEDGRTISLYLAYFEKQDSAKELVSTRLTALYKGASAMELMMRDGSSVKTALTTYRTDKNHATGIFWLNIRGRNIINRYEAKLSTVLNSFLSGKNNGSLVLVSSVPGHDPQAAGAEDVKEFIKDAAPLLRLAGTL